ncbi:hypothetical protein BVX98_00945, partial [bacterium F11]
SPTFLVTTGTGTANGGHDNFPMEFFTAGSVRIKATAPGGTTRTSNSFTVNTSSARKLVVLGPGMTLAEGTNPNFTSGFTGSFTPQEPDQGFTITVYLTDNQFNVITNGTDTVRLSTANLVTIPQATEDLLNGFAQFNDIEIDNARITRSIIATDLDNANVANGILSITTAGPPTKEVFPFPSPFNPRQGNITFRFRVSAAKSVTLIVTDLFGQKIWEKSVSAQLGFNDVDWNGKNEKGIYVAAGVYYVLIETGGSIESKRRFGVVK